MLCVLHAFLTMLKLTITYIHGLGLLTHGVDSCQLSVAIFLWESERLNNNNVAKTYHLCTKGVI